MNLSDILILLAVGAAGYISDQLVPNNGISPDLVNSSVPTSDFVTLASSFIVVELPQYT